MISIARKGLFALLAFAGTAVWSQASRADWYQTWYPPYYGPPAVDYGWVAPPPVYYAPPAPYRTYERWSGNPYRPNYRYEEKYPGGLEYKYRAESRRDGIRVREKWDD